MDQHVIDYLNFCQHRTDLRDIVDDFKEWEVLLDKLNEFSVLADESNSTITYRKISGDKK
jgi:hypothetical protein